MARYVITEIACRNSWQKTIEIVVGIFRGRLSMGLKLPKATFFRTASDARAGHGKQGKQDQQDQFLFYVEAFMLPIPQRNYDALPKWNHNIFPNSIYCDKDHHDLCAGVEILSQWVIVFLIGCRGWVVWSMVHV
jgi:hypothetical protein